MPESDARSVERTLSRDDLFPACQGTIGYYRRGKHLLRPTHSTLIGVSSGWRQANSHRPTQSELTLKFLAEQEEVGENPVEV